MSETNLHAGVDQRRPHTNGYFVKALVTLPVGLRSDPYRLVLSGIAWLRGGVGLPMISFEDEAGEKLPHELESYDCITGSLVAWVRLRPLAEGTVSTFWFCCHPAVPGPDEADPVGVWSDTEAVW